MTAAELLRTNTDDGRYELVRGEVRKFPFRWARDGSIAAQIIGSVGHFADAHRCGTVLSSGAGFHIESDPDTVLAPAAAFVRAERYIDTEDFFPGAPDIAFEFTAEHAYDWLASGASAVVVVSPETKSVEVHRLSGVTSITDTLTLDDIIPGWSLPLAEIFE